MLNWMNSWLRGIIIAVVISTIIEMIIPNGNIKKYIKTVIGVYIIFVIISPVITKITGKEINITKYIEAQMEKYKVEETVKIDTNVYIKQTYIENIKKDVIKELEAKGYKISNIQIEINEDEVEYGKLKEIALTVMKNTKDIEPIEISINKSETTSKKNSITDEEKEEIRKFIETTYGIEQTNIIIN